MFHIVKHCFIFWNIQNITICYSFVKKKISNRLIFFYTSTEGQGNFRDFSNGVASNPGDTPIFMKSWEPVIPAPASVGFCTAEIFNFRTEIGGEFFPVFSNN